MAKVVYVEDSSLIVMLKPSGHVVVSDGDVDLVVPMTEYLDKTLTQIIAEFRSIVSETNIKEGTNASR